MSDAVVVAVPDQRWGERPLALVVLKPDAMESGTPQQLREHVAHSAEKGLISRYAVPDIIKLIDTFDAPALATCTRKPCGNPTLRSNTWSRRQILPNGRQRPPER